MIPLIRAWADRVLPHSLRPVALFHYRRVRSRLERELPLICEGLRPGLTAVDVGANEGLFTHAFARTGATVESFEPLPASVASLRAYERNRPNVRVHQVALGEASGEAELHVPVRGGRAVKSHASLKSTGVEHERHRVQVRTLDSFGLERVASIKIDVEGHELEVLRGARETIARWRPRLLVEIEVRHREGDVHPVFDFLSALGYDGSFVDTSGVHSLSSFDPRVHQRIEEADRLGGYYINNFLFVPRAAE